MQPLDEELKKSESSKSHLGHVLSCWLGILERLENRKRQTLLSNLNPFWPQGTVPLHNVINDKSNQSILQHITFFQKIVRKAFLHTSIAKFKYFSVDIQPLRPITGQYASKSRASEFKNHHSNMSVAAGLSSVIQNYSGTRSLAIHSC